MFDRIHGRYDLLNRVLSLGLDVLWRRRAIRELGVGPSDRVIDLCCGTGDLTQEIARVVGPSGRVVGVDFAAGMLSLARHKFPGLEFVQGDALAVPLEGPFDAATLAFGPRNIHDLPGLWRELRRLVRPGGRIMSLELTRPSGLLGWLHGFYLRQVLPRLGSWLSGDNSAYLYLCTTIAGFLDREQLSESMRQGGLLEVRAIPLHFGIVTVHVATVP
jgi:demethylmenaquinone methyltransferase/2-methoxy-6-polyprenyl-1,4-benzoquinol methylase